MLTPDERRHADSITDSNPLLAPIPPDKVPRILIGCVIRKPAEIVHNLLLTLQWQKFKKPVEIEYVFITDYPSGDADGALVETLIYGFHGKKTVIHNTNPGGDYGEGQGTRQWTPNAWHRVGTLKNRMIQLCLDGRFDALWLLDADVLCDPWTLQSLIDCEAPIVAGVYWTHWRIPQPHDNQVIHAGPQVWLRHPYVLSGHGFTEASFRDTLVKRGLVRVFGLGACTLFNRSALEKGVSFTPIPEGLPPGPMADGEDRHLCERATRLHVPLYADAWPDIYHAYHPSQYDKIPAMMKRLGADRPDPKLGDSVSLRIDMLEPIPVPGNAQMLQYLGPQYIRGRLGIMDALPELEEAISGLEIGERRLVKLHYPVHYEYDTLRMQSRLISVILLDRKPYRLAPEIEQEMFVGDRSGSIKDPTTLDTPQMEEMMEEARDSA